MKRDFTVDIGRDEDGIYVASVPELIGCHTQVKTLGELRKGITEVAQLYLEGDQNLRNGLETHYQIRMGLPTEDYKTSFLDIYAEKYVQTSENVC